MNAANINPETLERLQQRALAAGCSLDALLNQLLEGSPPIAQHAENEALFKTLVDSASVMLWLLSPEKKGVFFNQGWLNFTGRTLAEELGDGWEEGIHPDDYAGALNICSTGFNTRQPFAMDYRLRRADGVYRWVLDTGAPYFAATGEFMGFIGACIDITERKEVETRLHQSEARLRSIAESQQVFIIRTDLSGNYTYINPAWQKQFGWLKTELIGSSSLDSIYSGDHDKTREAVARCLLNPNEVVQVILRKPTPQPGVLMWTLWDFTVILDDDQLPCEIQCIGFDITQKIEADQMRLEQERLNVTLKKEQEFNALVQKAVFALDHDIRTPLSVIAMSQYALDRYFDRLDEEKRHEKLDSIGKQLHYVSEMLDRLALTVKGTLGEWAFKPVSISLEALCQASIHEIATTIGIEHYMLFVTDGQIQTAVVDETLISRILLNLLSNAVKFSPKGSEIRLILTQYEAWIILYVVDQGMGISDDDLPHIFEPFYRSSAADQIRGTGLGLNIVKDCVTHHHGQISVESRVGMGTIFTVELPFVID